MRPRPQPHLLAAALRALDGFRATSPAHAAWITQGAPRLTVAEHQRRFGEAYARSTPKRAST